MPGRIVPSVPAAVTGPGTDAAGLPRVRAPPGTPEQATGDEVRVT
ncbi:hypothetical protein [Streptomyces sp. NPDC101181]